MKESDEQRQLIQWARGKQWGQFLFHIPNESVGGMGWVVRNRQMGMRKGVPANLTGPASSLSKTS